jgi:acyl-coenzyme A synthetase/AMP-(fatty) acid ligase
MLSRFMRRLTAGRQFHIGQMFHDAAVRHGDTPVVLDRSLGLAPEAGTEHTVAGLAGLVDELAAGLGAAGVSARQHVAVYKTNNFDIALLAAAVSRLGAIPAMLAPPLPGEVVGKLLRRLDNPWLITDAGKLDEAWGGQPPDAPMRGVLLSDGGKRLGTAPLTRVTDGPPRRPVLLGPREPALITHSSGTTGVPKLAVHCPNSLWNRLMPQKLMAWPIRGREPVGICMTFVHSRFFNALRVFLDHGNPLVVAVDHEPEAIGPLFARTRPGYVETHPNVYIEWEALVDAPGEPLASVRVFGGTFDAMHPRTIRRLLEASRRNRPIFFQLYGQSETGPVTARWHSLRGVRKSDARGVGVPLPGFTRVRVTGPDGRPVARGATGHLEADTRGRILTYHGEEERYAAELNDGWWRMGDLGARNRWGMVFLLDREVDRIESVDSNLHAEDVLMARMSELREVAIVEGVGGAPVPVVCTQDERPLDRTRWQHAADDLVPLAAPVQLPFDAVPRTSTWKVQRSELVRLLQESNVDGNVQSGG